MGKLFDINNPVWSTIGKLVDVFFLHLFWVICCIPIVTIGPATIALYYSTMKTVKDENTHITRTYFRAFKENLRKGIPMGMIFLVVGVLLFFALYFYTQQGNETGTFIWKAMRVVTMALGVIYIFMLQYVYPLMARFENTLKQTLLNSLLMSIKNLGWTVLMIIILIAPYLVIYYTNFYPLFLIAYGLVVFADSYILNNIFEPFIKAALGETENADPDHWEIPDEETGAAGEAIAETASPEETPEEAAAPAEEAEAAEE